MTTEASVEISGPQIEGAETILTPGALAFLAATAEISRCQIWQWVHNDVRLDDGTAATEDLVRESPPRSRSARCPNSATRTGKLPARGRTFETVAPADDFADFLTVPAYALID